MKKLLIEGDSWGRGAWHTEPLTNEYRPYHDGFAKYAEMDGLEVDLLASGGKRLGDFFKARRYVHFKTYDYIVAFITEPLRHYNLKYISSYDQLIALQKTILLEYLKQFNDFDAKVYLLGGVHKLDEEMIAPFKNLEVLIPSVSEFIYPDYTHPEVWVDTTMLDSLGDISEELLDKLLYQKELRDNMASEKYKELFYPDGYHPNHIAIKNLYDYFTNKVF